MSHNHRNSLIDCSRMHHITTL
ncbi:hypothetical protein F383_35492 [Gossypium arboreum]|uniref:Uncharacterized protein n=1 Tax=Gossypium arboreum TaxID=29729 RepID=A0A0B0PSY9_GOSAR|nr:hypothetical protein F383_37372 [Gossypium arboreum]KHG11861.1 hypothetical protein F383_18243 [Gossypium arboreum]KHG16276.1 hypothetical protein F383_21015 [Gossypium arboreum]KHG27891.1 hypothetical protein F383_15224 [Gossypium arboreum]KHG28125.1 hypothetical protein F383_35056 [Gossypium arboreum]